MHATSKDRTNDRSLFLDIGAGLSPDLNPIELDVAKLKALLRKAAERSIEDLWTPIGTLLDAFPQDECRNDFKHTGYA